MDLQEEYDELDNIISTLDALICEIKDKYYIDSLNDLKFEAQTRLDEIEPELVKQQYAEEQEMNYEFEMCRV